MTSEQSLAASSTSFSVTIVTVNISHSYKKIYRTWRFGGTNVNKQRENLQDMFEMASFHTDTGLKPLSPLIDGPVNDCLPKVWPYINQVLFQLVDVACALLINMDLEDSPKFCNRPDRSGLLGGQTSGEMKSGVAWRKYSTVARTRWAGAL